MHIGFLSIFQNYRDEQNDADTMRGELALARLAEALLTQFCQRKEVTLQELCH